MRRALVALSLATAPVALLAACSPGAEQTAESGYDMATSRASIADVEMAPDTSYLTEEERQVVNLLIEASGYMDEIYLRQRGVQLPQLRETISRSRRADRDLLVAMFDRNFGPWDEVAELRPFWGTQPMPEGAGFYPADLTRAEFDAYLAANPDQREALTSPYTVVERRGDGAGTADPAGGHPGGPVPETRPAQVLAWPAHLHRRGRGELHGAGVGFGHPSVAPRAGQRPHAVGMQVDGEQRTLPGGQPRGHQRMSAQRRARTPHLGAVQRGR